MHDSSNVSVSSAVFGRALDDRRALDFAKRVKLADYRGCTSQQQTEVSKAYEDALTLLKTVQQEPSRLPQALRQALVEFFHYHEPEHWLRRFHDYDARPSKFRHQFSLIARHLRGNTIIDIGCGTGHLASVCAERGYQLLIADLMDYRSDGARSLPFRIMNTPGAIPFPKDAADVAFAFSVLHHVAPEHLEQLLAELRRVASRIIVCEDVYGLAPDDPLARNMVQVDDLLADFLRLSVDEQRHVLVLLDVFSNVFDRGVPEMQMPFEFKAMSDWRLLLERHGFKHNTSVLLGFRREAMHVGTCQALLVFDRDTRGSVY